MLTNETNICVVFAYVHVYVYALVSSLLQHLIIHIHCGTNPGACLAYIIIESVDKIKDTSPRHTMDLTQPHQDYVQNE